MGVLEGLQEERDKMVYDLFMRAARKWYEETYEFHAREWLLVCNRLTKAYLARYFSRTYGLIHPVGNLSRIDTEWGSFRVKFDQSMELGAFRFEAVKYQVEGVL